MRRPWQPWVLFAICLVVAVAAMAWISIMALQLDRTETEAQWVAALEENVRLALWRLESALAGLIAHQSNQPYFEYASFYPLERAYTRMFNEISLGEVLVPSRLLTFETPHVSLHFQINPDGEVTSPQVPFGNMRDLAEAVYTTSEEIEAAAKKLRDLKPLLDRELLLSALPEGVPMPEPVPLPNMESNELVQNYYKRNTEEAQAELSQQEFVMRDRGLSNISSQKSQLKTRKQEPQKDADDPRAGKEEPVQVNETREEEVFFLPDDSRGQAAAASGRDSRNKAPLPSGSPDVSVGAFKSVWLGSELALVRRVAANSEEYVQGSWLDWPGLKEGLLGEIADLLPAADLVPAPAESGGSSTRMLAALPVMLLPGVLTMEEAVTLTPIDFSLIVAWSCVLLAGAAVAVLLRGAISLSERRGAFVSAVTHELRTPLTTLRMYTEMLAENMVPTKEKRAGLLHTMQAEADRLGHLVENVLSYSRLERQRSGARMETITAGALFERVTGRLAQHAERASMKVDVFLPEEAGQTKISVNAQTVEQILFNLVDNACKYAAAASEKTIRLEADRQGGRLLLKVRDHGPGIRRQEERRLFKPFCKSARDAAISAPGVGLGLALSRRLAREMGGDLCLDQSISKGACFVLLLPLAGSAGRKK